MTIHELLIAPFDDYGFMRRALVASVALGLGAGPVGVLLVLRRMSLFGEALSHAVLPGAAVGFVAAGGLSLLSMGAGGVVAGLVVALLSGLVSRNGALKEDASLASFYLISLALGVLIVSLRGSNIDLLHVLFGTILAVDAQAMYIVGGIATFTLAVLVLVYRPLVMECFDPAFMRAVGGRGPLYHLLFLLLVTINLVSGFQTLGTLMAVGMMMLPAIISQFWNFSLPVMFVASALSAIFSGFVGLLISYHLGFPSGPSIILTSGFIYVISLLLSPRGVVQRFIKRSPGQPSLSKTSYSKGKLLKWIFVSNDTSMR